MSEIQVGQINSTDGSTAITTGAGGTVTLSAALTGTDATLSGGVYLGGTGAANYLSTVEQGSWTPSSELYAGSFSSAFGYYYRIGDMCYIFCRVDLDGTSDTAQYQIANLPFAMVAPTGFDPSRLSFPVVFLDAVPTGDNPDYIYANANGSGSTSLGLKRYGNDPISFDEIGGSNRLVFYGWMPVAG